MIHRSESIYSVFKTALGSPDISFACSLIRQCMLKQDESVFLRISDVTANQLYQQPTRKCWFFSNRAVSQVSISSFRLLKGIHWVDICSFIPSRTEKSNCKAVLLLRFPTLRIWRDVLVSVCFKFYYFNYYFSLPLQRNPYKVIQKMIEGTFWYYYSC